MGKEDEGVEKKSGEFIALKKKLDAWKSRFIVCQSKHNNWLAATTSPHLAEVSLIASKLETLDEVLNECQEEFQDLTEPTEIEEINKNLNTFISSLYSVQVKVMAIKMKLETAQESRKSQHSTPFKLEKLQLPKFSGKFSDWNNFQDLFESAVVKNHTLTDTEKMVYLKMVLTGEATSIVSTFSTATTSFSAAWDLVKSRFSNKREIVFAHIRKFDNLPNVAESSSGLRKLVDTMNECTSSLSALGVPVDTWDVILVYLSLKKLDPDSKKEWLLTQTTALPVLSNLLAFLEKRATVLADSTISKPKPKSESSSHFQSNEPHSQQSNQKSNPQCSSCVHSSSPPQQSTPVSNPNSIPPSSSKSKYQISCVFCKEAHHLHNCKSFSSLSVAERNKIVTDNHLCKNCMFKGHGWKSCPMAFSCKYCNQKHHTLLHFPSSRPESNSQSQSDPPVEDMKLYTASHSSVGASNQSSSQIHVPLIETALVYVKDSNGTNQICRVFLDSASEDHFITENCVNRLGLSRRKTCIETGGIGGAKGPSVRGWVELQMSSRVQNYNALFPALILPKITGSYLPKTQCQGFYEYLSQIKLADPQFSKPGKIDILIGTRLRTKLLLPGLIQGPAGQPDAQNSVLGWIISGESPAISSSHFNFSVFSYHSKCSSSEPCLESRLEKFMEIENPDSSKLSLSSEDQLCEQQFQSTVARMKSGRYVVNLPFRPNPPPLGNSRTIAINRFKSFENSLSRNPEVSSSYHKQMKENLAAHIMEEVPESQIINSNSYYMPHHVVSKLESSSTKHRIVFDASAKSSNGLSLNDILMTGPKISTDLIPLLINFRTHLIAVSADIVKFYNQFYVSEPDADFQRLVSRESPAHPIKDYRMVRVTFGVTSAPYLAIRCLHQLAEDHQLSHPLAYQALKHHFLVDNLLSGGSSAEEVQGLQSQIVDVCAKAQLKLRKWSSNSEEALSKIPVEDRELQVPLQIATDEFIKTIGILWNPSSDSFSIKLPEESPVHTLTKRQLLSSIARVFDPLGWISPVTIQPKVILQKVWKLKLEWDVPIPEELLQQYNSYITDQQKLKTFSTYRCIVLSPSSRSPTLPVVHELHGFSDASIHAFTGCVYLKTICGDSASVNLIISKTKVCPVRAETIPRLELCGAELLSKLINICKNSLNLSITDIVCYTDSTSVLGWLDKDPSQKLEIFVLNRVRKIQNSLPNTPWKFVEGTENPADLGTRINTSSKLLSSSFWLRGPTWLSDPVTFSSFLIHNPISSTHVVSAHMSKSTYPFHQRILEFIQNSSSFLSMQRKLAMWIRFVHNLSSKNNRRSGQLTVQEIQSSLNILIRTVQQEVFHEEINYLTKKSSCPTSKFKNLTPFLDSQRILRVGGRLRNSFFTYDQQHPILLPKDHHFTWCIVRFYHETYMHPGPQLLLTLLRQKFWIPRGPQTCSRIVRSCVKCHHANPIPLNQLMGQLPSHRVQPSRPFSHVGIDYAGPFHLSYVRGRNPRTIKSYVCVFVCLAVKAIHLEFSGDLTTESYLAALKRFTSRRGLPSKIICDGGRNFLGARNEVLVMQKFLSSAQTQSLISKFFVDQGIEYVFNPPLAPHHGGIFEAGVKSMKVHLNRVVEDRRLTIEEFITILCEVEAILNSRPITPMSSDSNDFNVLTPAHFLIGGPLKSVPQENLINHKVHSLSRWRHLQQMVQHFFTRWSSQYLQSLQKSQKWFSEQPNLGVGMLVLLNQSESQIGPQNWKLGRISQVHPGDDGLVRVVDVTIPITTGKEAFYL